MTELIKCELYKIKKKGILSYLILLSVLPILFLIYGAQGKLILLEENYSMLQWLGIILFQLCEQFLIFGIILSLIYEFVVKEYQTGYINMIKIRDKSDKILTAKIISSILTSTILLLFLLIIISVSYLLLSNKSNLISGNIINISIKKEWLSIKLIGLFLLRYGFFIPTLAVNLTDLRLKKHFIIFPILIGIEFLDRIVAKTTYIQNWAFWFWMKKGKYIVSNSSKGNIFLPVTLMICIIIFIKCVILFQRRQNL